MSLQQPETLNTKVASITKLKWDENRAKLTSTFIPIEFRNDRDYVLRNIKQYAGTFEWASEALRTDRELIMEGLVKQSAHYELRFIDDNLKSDHDFINKMIRASPCLLDNAKEYHLDFVLDQAVAKNSKGQQQKKTNSEQEKKNMMEKLEKNEIEYENLPLKLKTDADICMVVIKRDLKAMWEVLPNVSANKDIILRAVKEVSELAFVHADTSLKKDKLFVSRLIKINPHLLFFADKEVKKDKSIVSEAVKLDVETLNYASSDLLKDLTFVTKAKSTGGTKNSKNHKEFILKAVSYFSGVVELIPLSLRKDLEFMLQVVSAAGSDAFQHVSEKLKSDKEFVFRCIKSMESCFMLESYLPASVLADKDIVLALVEKSPCAYREFKTNTELQFTKEIMLKVVRECASEYEQFPEEFKRDEEIALEAIRSGSATLIMRVPEELKKDKKFVLKCIQENAQVIGFCSSDFKTSPEFCLEAIQLNGCALRYTPDKTREMEIEAVKQNGFFLPSNFSGELLKIRMEHEYPNRVD